MAAHHVTVETLEHFLRSAFVTALRVWTVRAGMASVRAGVMSVKSLPTSISLRLAGQHAWSNLQVPGHRGFLPPNTREEYHLRLTSGHHRHTHTCGCALAHLQASFMSSRVQVARRLFYWKECTHPHISLDTLCPPDARNSCPPRKK